MSIITIRRPSAGNGRTDTLFSLGKTTSAWRDAEPVPKAHAPRVSLRAMRRLLTFPLLLVFISIGCNTFEGAKEDAEDAGDAIEEGAEEVGDDIEDAFD